MSSSSSDSDSDSEVVPEPSLEPESEEVLDSVSVTSSESEQEVGSKPDQVIKGELPHHTVLRRHEFHSHKRHHTFHMLTADSAHFIDVNLLAKTPYEMMRSVLLFRGIGTEDYFTTTIHPRYAAPKEGRFNIIYISDVSFWKDGQKHNPIVLDLLHAHKAIVLTPSSDLTGVRVDKRVVGEGSFVIVDLKQPMSGQTWQWIRSLGISVTERGLYCTTEALAHSLFPSCLLGYPDHLFIDGMIAPHTKISEHWTPHDDIRLLSYPYSFATLDMHSKKLIKAPHAVLQLPYIPHPEWVALSDLFKAVQGKCRRVIIHIDLGECDFPMIESGSVKCPLEIRVGAREACSAAGRDNATAQTVLRKRAATMLAILESVHPRHQGHPVEIVIEHGLWNKVESEQILLLTPNNKRHYMFRV